MFSGSINYHPIFRLINTESTLSLYNFYIYWLSLGNLLKSAKCNEGICNERTNKWSNSIEDVNDSIRKSLNFLNWSAGEHLKITFKCDSKWPLHVHYVCERQQKIYKQQVHNCKTCIKLAALVYNIVFGHTNSWHTHCTMYNAQHRQSTKNANCHTNTENRLKLI